MRLKCSQIYHVTIEFSGRYKLGAVGIETIFKIIGLDEFTSGVSIVRKKLVQGLSLGIFQNLEVDLKCMNEQRRLRI